MADDAVRDGGLPTVRAASFTLRVFAGAVDLVVVGTLAVGGTLAWFSLVPPEFPPRYWNHLDYLVDLVNTRPDLVLVPLVAFAGTYVLWTTAFTVALGNSPVARLFGMRVVTGRGRPVGVIRAFARALLSLAFAAAAFAGPLWALVSPRRRMLHDILCGCHVVRGDVLDGPRPEVAPVDDGMPAWEAGPRR
jgi:uncharacterized RDD family membrane protein YckC